MEPKVYLNLDLEAYKKLEPKAIERANEDVEEEDKNKLATFEDIKVYCKL